MRANGQLSFNTTTLIRHGALAGLGLAFVPEEVVREDIKKGRLVRVLKDWATLSSGYHLYYPSRRLQTPAFSLFVDAVRYRG